MARVHGRKGRLYVGLASDTATAQEVAYLKGWEINFETDDVDVTAFGDLNKTSLAGLPDSSGTFDGFYDDSSDQLYTAATDGAARRFYLYPTTPSSAGPYWFGTATFDFSVSAAVDDAVKISGGYAATSAVRKV
jgi:predicted secreted protein